MICPYCSSGLDRETTFGITVDLCSKCGGIWFDSGEVAPYFRTVLSTEEASLPKPGPTAPKAKSIKEVQEEGRNCPRCLTMMRKFNYGYDSNVILDKCDSCGGVWVDGTEVRPLAIFLKGSAQ